MLRVLTYHRVAAPTETPALNPRIISATPATFDRQMGHLAKHYRVVSAKEVLDAQRAGGSLPSRALLITFDDAYRDFGEIAWPILRRYGLPATLFVPTGYPGRPDREFWWDRLYRAFTHGSRRGFAQTPVGSLPLDTPEARRTSLGAMQQYLKTIPHAEAMQLVDRLCREPGERIGALPVVLDWDELRELAGDGVTLGAHTRTHPALTQLPVEQARAEIRGSREDLEREIGGTLPIFAYPFGAHNDRVVEVVREEGFELALTCIDGQNGVPSRDPLRLRRTNITPRTSPLIFRLRLLRIGSYIDGWRHRTGRGRRHHEPR